MLRILGDLSGIPSRYQSCAQILTYHCVHQYRQVVLLDLVLVRSLRNPIVQLWSAQSVVLL
jgi:hypothetical protein